MEKCFRICPKCGCTFARFYVKEEPTPDKPFMLVVFQCILPECHHEYEEPIYDLKTLRKIQSDGYRKWYDDVQVEGYKEAERATIDREIKRRAQMKLDLKGGLSPWEIEKKLKLKIKKVA